MKKKIKYFGIIIIALIIIIPVIFKLASEKPPYYKERLPLLLNVDNIEAEYIEGEYSWCVSYEVYKLSDETLIKFLQKEHKVISDLEGYKKINWRRGMLDSLSFKEYVSIMQNNNYKMNLNVLQQSDSLAYYKYYKGSLTYKQYMDSVSFLKEINNIQYIEKNLFYTDNGKMKKNSDNIKNLYYNNSYYALYYKTINLFWIYMLDEKNNLLYMTLVWL